ncbi:MAG: hypothetical protein R3F04_05005 [Lysobacteraceae bacterium]
MLPTSRRQPPDHPGQHQFHPAAADALAAADRSGARRGFGQPPQFFGGQYQEGRNFFPQFVVNPQRLRRAYPEWVMEDDQWRAFISTQDGANAGKNIAERNG